MDTKEIERPVLAVDTVIFGIEHGCLTVLLHRRNADPYKGALALPGVAVRIHESLEDAARRALKEKTGWDSKEILLDQLAAFDSLYRDPRGRTVSVAYMGLTPDISKELIWKHVSIISKSHLPFDHGLIFDTAVTRLKGKLRYTNIAKGFLPDEFRIEELQTVYEAIMERSLNRSNFRNKLLKIGLIEQVDVLTNVVGKKGGRPPHKYRFTDIEVLDRDFL